MMKSFVIQQNQMVVSAAAAVEENMSNLTSASNEASASSITRNDSGNMPPQLYDFAAPIQNQAQPTTTKKKRNLPGNPDPESEVIALSPKTLMATNRFLCEICNKGFQRDQNLQLHRRGHNLPWKLKQRTSKEIRKKVYVCPEVSCIHHEPSRALGDLTGIKKHFCRKHGEKKWKCDKCSKRYAVQSDWKAHSKTCGTREYRCDCGTLFSRRDSFITHRAFCDALAEESTRAITGGGNHQQHQQLLSSPVAVAVGSSSSSQHFQFTSSSNHHHDIPLQIFAPLKKEHHNFTLRPPEIPPWLSCPQDHLTNPSVFHSEFGDNDNNNPSSSTQLLGPNNLLPSNYLQANSPHMSATALLQKAAQMGATMSMNSKTCSLPAMLRPHQAHESVNSTTTIGSFGTTTTVNNLSSREEQLANRNATFVNGLVGGVANKAATAAAASSPSGTTSRPPPPPPSMLQDMMMMNSLSSSSFEDAFGGIFKEEGKKQMLFHHHTNESGSGGQDSSSTMSGMTTRDFLGLRPLSQNDIFLNIAALGNCMNNGGGSNHHDQNTTTTTNQETWPHGH